MPEEEKDKGGRPTDYRVAFNKQAYKLTLLGAKDKELADFFEVSEATLNNWKAKHPRFLASIKKGKDLADATVADSLYKRATGYNAPDVDIRVMSVIKEKDKPPVNEIIQTPIVKHYAPDPLSMIFWLKNRQPALWREKKEIDHHLDGPVTFSYGTPDPANDPIDDQAQP